MLYVKRNCEVSLFGVPSIISVKVDCYCDTASALHPADTFVVTHFGQFISAYDNNGTC